MGKRRRVKRPLANLPEEYSKDSPEPAAAASKRKVALRPEESIWWFWQAWLILRPFVIDFAKDVVVFGLFLLSLEGFHQVVNMTSLEAGEKAMLHKVHFYCHFVVLGIFGLSFIIRVISQNYEELVGDNSQ